MGVLKCFHSLFGSQFQHYTHFGLHSIYIHFTLIFISFLVFLETLSRSPHEFISIHSRHCWIFSYLPPFRLSSTQLFFISLLLTQIPICGIISLCECIWWVYIVAFVVNSCVFPLALYELFVQFLCNKIDEYLCVIRSVFFLYFSYFRSRVFFY